MCGFIQGLNGLINMEIKRVIVGPLEENCYIVTKNNQTIIIDPGDEAEKIIALVERAREEKGKSEESDLDER